MLIVLKQSPRAFLPKLDFITSAGHMTGGDSRAKSGATGKGPTAIITDLGILTPHAETNTVMLPHSLRFVGHRAPEVLAPLRSVLGDSPADAVAAVAGRAGVDGLSALGVAGGDLDAVVEAALQHPAIGLTPGGTPSASEIRTLLTAAL